MSTQQEAAAKALARQRKQAQAAHATSDVGGMPEDIEGEVLEQLAISSDLRMEFGAQPAYFARWSFLYARAQDFARQMEEQVEVSFYTLYDEYRSDHADAKENECKSHVRTHSAHQKLTAALRRAQYTVDILKATVRAFEQRRDMLIQLGAQERSELEGTDMQTRVRRANRIVKDSLKGKRRGHEAEDED